MIDLISAQHMSSMTTGASGAAFAEMSCSKVVYERIGWEWRGWSVGGKRHAFSQIDTMKAKSNSGAILAAEASWCFINDTPELNPISPTHKGTKGLLELQREHRLRWKSGIMRLFTALSSITRLVCSSMVMLSSSSNESFESILSTHLEKWRIGASWMA